MAVKEGRAPQFDAAKKKVIRGTEYVTVATETRPAPAVSEAPSEGNPEAASASTADGGSPVQKPKRSQRRRKE